MRSITTALLICVACTVTVVAGQQPSTPGSIPAGDGTGAISGVVVDRGTNRPLAGVVVTLGPAPRESVRPARVITDIKGRFVFRDLPPFDGYVINAGKAGYANGHYGPGSASANIGIADGQWFADARFTMSRLGAISGTVTDELGEPMVGVYVRVLRQIVLSGAAQLAAGSITTTDDRGMYRISGLVPGKYFVTVPSVQSTIPESTTMAQLAGMTPQQIATNEAAGRPTTVDPLVESDDGTRLAVGRYATPPPVTSRVLVYPAVFYPTAAAVGEASPIDVGDGTDRAGIDFALAPVATSKVSGVVEGPPEARANLILRLLSAGSEELGDGAEVATALVDSNGRFIFLGVPPGSYTIDANRIVTQLESGPGLGGRALPRPTGLTNFGTVGYSLDSGPSGMSIFSRNGSGAAYWGRSKVTVGAQNVPDVVVTMQKAVTLSGRVVWDGPPPANRPSSASFWLEPARGNPSLGRLQTRGPSGSADTFMLEGLLAGEYVLRGGGYVKSVTWQGRDYTYAPFDGSSGRDIADVTVTLTSETTLLSGIVRDARGVPTPNAVVLFFPVEREQWSGYGYTPLRIKTAQPGLNGAYRMQDLPAGDYYAIAIDGSTNTAWQDPTFFAAAVPLAARVALAWGDKATKDLALTPIR